MRRDIDFTRGQTFSFSGQVRDADGNGVDLTAATSMTWRLARQNCRIASVILTEANSDITVDSSGNWTVTIDPADTEDLLHGWWRHQGEYILSGTHCFTEGRARLRRDINS